MRNITSVSLIGFWAFVIMVLDDPQDRDIIDGLVHLLFSY